MCMDKNTVNVAKYFLKDLEETSSQTELTMNKISLKSNIAYAEVLQYDEYDNRISLKVQNLPEDTDITATISKKQFPQGKIPQVGERLLVRFSNDSQNKNNKIAILLSKCNGKKHVYLTGEFNKIFGKKFFKAHDDNIKGEFPIQWKPEAIYEHGQHCQVIVPHDFTPYNPSIIVTDNQSIDLYTGKKKTDILIQKHRVSQTFSAAVLKETTVIKSRKIDRSIRVDMTDLPFFTIDPPGATDLDDALLVKNLGSCGWETITDVADVASYVLPHTEIDKASFNRGNTFYLPDRRIHMLPNDVTQKCSLLKGKERPVIYVKKFYDVAGNPIEDSTEIGLGVINSKAQLTYGQYQDMAYQNDPLVKDLTDFLDLQRERARKQPVYPNKLIKEEFNAFGSPVEGLMLDANKTIAKFTLSHNIPSYYRNHDPVLDARIYKKLRKKLNHLGFHLPKNPEQCSLKKLNALINEINQTDNLELQSRAKGLINHYLMDRAYYATENRGHYGLGLPEYTHFTSPIRRSPDIIVARAVHSILGSKYGLSDHDMKNIDQYVDYLNQRADISNERSQTAKDIEHELKRYNAISDLKRLEGNILHASILYVSKNNIEIMLPKHGLRTKIDSETLKKLGWKINRKNRSIFPENSVGKGLSRGEHIRSQLAHVVPEEAIWSINSLEPA